MRISLPYLKLLPLFPPTVTALLPLQCVPSTSVPSLRPSMVHSATRRTLEQAGSPLQTPSPTFRLETHQHLLSFITLLSTVFCRKTQLPNVTGCWSSPLPFLCVLQASPRTKTRQILDSEFETIVPLKFAAPHMSYTILLY